VRAVQPDPATAPAAATGDDRPDAALVELLRAGDADAFARIVAQWSPAMLRVAGTFTSSASAEDVVQETWLAVVDGLDRFEGRSSLRTWVFRILANRARTRGAGERRSVPWSAVAADTAATVEAGRFRGPADPWPGHWTSAGAPRRWVPAPEDAAVAGEIRARLAAALAVLPERQRVVVSLRDVHGLDSEEVCAALGITAANQRVLLHRGRARLRSELESYYREEASA
jgi:RNA polymerase sigma-70 factor, ECF subfamily